MKRSGLAERTFKRRFSQATGFAPIDCEQRLRVEDAKRRLERTNAPADEISRKVGYEDPSFFRRLFKRVTGSTPGAYGSASKCPYSLAWTEDKPRALSPFFADHFPDPRATRAQ